MKKFILSLFIVISVFMCLFGVGCGESEEGETAIDLDLTRLSSTMIYSEVFNMVNSPDAYVGKTIKIEGIYSEYYSTITGLHYPAIIIPDATACCSQGIEFVLKGKTYPNGYPSINTNITIVGEFDTYFENSSRYCHLKNAVIL